MNEHATAGGTHVGREGREGGTGGGGTAGRSSWLTTIPRGKSFGETYNVRLL